MERLTKIANKVGTDKGTNWEDSHGYTEFYQHFFEKYEHPNILEIGTYLGRSAKMFEDFYDGDCKIYTCDIVEDTWMHLSDVPTATYIYVNESDGNSLAELHEKLKDIKFDIIIDDASHIWQDQFNGLTALHDLLSDNGIYVLEDLHYSRLHGEDIIKYSPLYFLSFMFPSPTLGEKDNAELLNKIKDIQIFSRKNQSTKEMREWYGGRSMTAIITFEK